MQDPDGSCGSAAEQAMRRWGTMPIGWNSGSAMQTIGSTWSVPGPQFLARGSRSPTYRGLRWSIRSGMWGCKGLGSRALSKQSNLLNWLRSTKTGGTLVWLHHLKMLELEWSLWAIWRKAISTWSLCLLCWLATRRWFLRSHWLRCSMIGWSGQLQWAQWLSRGMLGSMQPKKWREAPHQFCRVSDRGERSHFEGTGSEVLLSKSTRHQWSLRGWGSWLGSPGQKVRQVVKSAHAWVVRQHGGESMVQRDHCHDRRGGSDRGKARPSDYAGAKVWTISVTGSRSWGADGGGLFAGSCISADSTGSKAAVIARSFSRMVAVVDRFRSFLFDFNLTWI